MIMEPETERERHSSEKIIYRVFQNDRPKKSLVLYCIKLLKGQFIKWTIPDELPIYLASHEDS